MITIKIIINNTSKILGRFPSPFNLSLRKKHVRQLRNNSILSKKFILEVDKIDTLIVLDATPQHSLFRQTT